jgi:hypothetical protein
VPASLLRRQPNATFLLDPDATAALKREPLENVSYPGSVVRDHAVWEKATILIAVGLYGGEIA